MLKLNDKVSIRIGTTEITGQLVGIDQYKLENFSGKACQWPSYTFTSNSKGLFSRYWLVLWDKSKWILWTKITSKNQPQANVLILEKSGIAQIAFTGDFGQSTPMAALAQYKEGKEYFCIERFTGSEVMFFRGQEIPKPKVLSASKKK